MLRTRFAPSPTGFLHVGSLRTALYNYLLARKHKGQFVLRIEDTDQTRYVEGSKENLLKILNTVNLHYDEGPEKEGEYGPYIQSQRTEVYRKYAQELLNKKAAYRCFCTSERLQEMRENQTKAKQAPMYDRKCLNLSEEEIKKNLDSKMPFVIRQKIPQAQKLQFTDSIRGIVTFNTSTIDDQVLIKSDNFPTYHLANVVDDYLMKITHVIRGEEWLPSTPKHILLYESFGWDHPQFAHIPLLLNKDKSKLSKRQGDVSVESYLEKGYSPEALLNFVALLGWHPGEGIEQEIFTIDELIENFSLEKVHKGGAIFDIEKLDWFNYQWNKKNFTEKLRELAQELEPEVQITSNQRKETVFTFESKEKNHKFTEVRAELLAEICKDYIPSKWTENLELLMKSLITVEDKILKNPKQIQANIDFFFEAKDIQMELMLNEKMKVDKETAKKALEESIKTIESFDDFDEQQKIQELFIEVIQKLGLKNGQVLWPLRVALTGAQFSPGVFELMWALGKQESTKRLKEVLNEHF